MLDKSGRNAIAALLVGTVVIGVCAYILLSTMRGCGTVMELLFRG